jgi:CDP-diacylglycerol--serine O-phosphatidyltransferase
MLNLFSGCIGISEALSGNLSLAAAFIGISAVFDFFDGFTARLLNVKSDIGKQLDSLADVVSFGLLPGMIVYMMMNHSSNLPFKVLQGISLLPYLAFAIPVFSALRLAKFNLDSRQTDAFLGLPTPASAIFFGSLPLIINNSGISNDIMLDFLSNFYFLLFLVIIFCILLVSEVPLFALKFKSFSWAGNKAQYLLLAISIPLIIILGFAGIPLIIVSYILLSLTFR